MALLTLRGNITISYNTDMIARNLLTITLMAGCATALAGAEAGAPCSDEWNRQVDAKVITGDGQGHGPDIGSDEWKSVVEFKLGIRDQPDLPDRGSDDWCQLIDRMVGEQ